VKGGVNSGRIALLVDKRGIDFTPTVQFLRGLMNAGADDVLIQAILKAKPSLLVLPTCPASPLVPPAVAAGDSAARPANAGASSANASSSSTSHDPLQTLQQNLDHAADLEQHHQWAEDSQQPRRCAVEYG
jgi:hypothetical protein